MTNQRPEPIWKEVGRMLFGAGLALAALFGKLPVLQGDGLAGWIKATFAILVLLIGIGIAWNRVFTLVTDQLMRMLRAVGGIVYTIRSGQRDERDPERSAKTTTLEGMPGTVQMKRKSDPKKPKP